jgi:DNA processing protein
MQTIGLDLSTVEKRHLHQLPEAVQQINSPPEQLYIRAESGAFDDLMSRPRVAVVGSRRLTGYGKTATAMLVSELASQGVVVVSGLAYGADYAAHLAALEAGGLTMAVLPSPVENIYPSRHYQLAMEIVQTGGALISEYPQGMPNLKQHFIARNRLVTALADALLITEATEKSGTLHTARFALEQGREVMAVPGHITSPLSDGTNQLIKAGAHLIMSTDDVLHIVGHEPRQDDTKKRRIRGANHNEQILIDLLERGVTEGHELLYLSGLKVSVFNTHLTMLEITGKIRSLGANRWTLG